MGAAAERWRQLRAGDRARRQGARLLAGVDEAGRGPLAGPVVAAAVVLPDDDGVLAALEGIDDSKRLSQPERERLLAVIESLALSLSIGVATREEVDAVNVLNAAHRAMVRAVGGLAVRPERVLIDGLPVPPLGCSQQSVVDGDAFCLSIAAAGIAAKVTRDRMMAELHHRYPRYRFDQHKGYGTAYHLAALDVWGPSEEHRRCYAPVAARAAVPPHCARFDALWERVERAADAPEWYAACGAAAREADQLAQHHRRMLALGLRLRAKELNLGAAAVRRNLAWAPSARE